MDGSSKFELSSYLTLVKQYYFLSKLFGWTVDEIDSMELEMYFDYILVSLIAEQEIEEMAQQPQVQKGTGADLLAMFNKGVK